MFETDNEFAAMQTVFAALESLEDNARQRVLGYVMSRLSIAPVSAGKNNASSSGASDAADTDAKTDTDFEEFGELFDAFDPRTDVERALVAAYWYGVSEGHDTFDSQSLNAMLKNLGHGLTNITRALGGLTDQKPALVIQTRKSGTSKQARKTYKLTRSGKKLVEDRLQGILSE